MTRFKGWQKIKQSPDGELYVSESTMQISCVQWFRTVWAKFTPFLFSIPNGAKIGGKVSKKGFPILAAILKAEGMTEGVSDLMLAFPRGEFHGLFIEMKTIVGSPSPVQRDFLELMASVGYAVAMPRSKKDFEKLIDDYMNERFVQTPVWQRKRAVPMRTKISSK